MITKKTFYANGLNFSVISGLIEYSEFLLLFELLFRDIKCIIIKDLSLIKARVLDTVLTSYQKFSCDPGQ